MKLFPLRLLLPVLTVSLLAGCTPTPAQQQTTKVTTTSTAALQAQISDSAGKPLAGVKLRFTNPLQTIFERVSDAAGLADLQGLQSGVPYLLAIDGTGLVPRQQVVQVPLTAAKSPALRLKIVLERAGFSQSGQILDSAGQPVGAAVIQAGDLSLETSADGRYSLALASQPTEISANKQGYKSCLLQQGSCRLERQTTALRLRTSESHLQLGLAADNFDKQAGSLLTDTRSAGYEVLAWPGQDLDPARDTLWLAAPAQAISDAEISQIKAFVSAGGKLVVNSEWAGFGSLDLGSLSNLLTGFGLAPGSDSLHQTQNLGIQLFDSSHPLLLGIQKLQLYRSGSVQLLQPEHARLLAYSSADGFRIAATGGGQGVLGCALAGKGKVVVLGDSSLWLEDDADGNGVANYKEADNAKLWKNILSW